MKYVGIDLGTTNSAICSYDGESVRLYKSPDQSDVTPSAIFIDRRGNKYLGRRAYDSAAKSPDNAATKFKRIMGTSTPIQLAAIDLTMTPEQCSAEIIKLCFGYLPDEIRNSAETGTVITVPAAFNQMQKDATLTAAEMAGLANVALMQEPVAAVMCVMKQQNSDGIFLVFDLGGGTLDIAIAESISGHVNLLAHGGIAMCGGTDFDRAILDKIVKPWMRANFNLPEDFSSNQKYKSLLRMCLWAAEKAKVELSNRDDAEISLSEAELGTVDDEGAEIYVYIPITRTLLDELMAAKIAESIQSARDAINKAGLSPHDIERIVFIGGPTQYKPLRDRVALELGIAASTAVNPMTAVAEGAAIFAESIDWASESRGRKSGRGTLTASGEMALTFNYMSRTPSATAKIVVRLGGCAVTGAEFQIDSLDTGWSSGRMALQDGATSELILSKLGENAFRVFVFDANGGPAALGEDTLVITRTASTIDAIPASHSIGIEVLDKLGGSPVLDFLVREGDQLPRKGKKSFIAAESLFADSTGSLKFKLWEGDISTPISDNRFIGAFDITGADFDEGVIEVGSELICDYEVTDSGNIRMEISVPAIGASFRSGRNFYSRQDGQIDYTKASQLVQEYSQEALQRLNQMAAKINDAQLDLARERLEQAALICQGESDPEIVKQAMDNVQEAKRLMAIVRSEHLSDMRQLELDKAIEVFNMEAYESARLSEVKNFSNLAKAAQRSIEYNNGDFEVYLHQLRVNTVGVLWRQDGFIIQRFNWYAKDSFLFPDQLAYAILIDMGAKSLESDDIEKLRDVVSKLESIRVDPVGGDEMMAGANIIRN